MTKQAFQMPPATPPRSTAVLDIPIYVLSILIVAVILGAILLAVSIYFGHLIFFSALIAAGIGQFIMVKLIQFTKMHYSGLGLIIGLLMGITIYGTYRVGEYLYVTNQWVDEIAELETAFTRSEISTFIQDDLEAETGSRGFVGFVLYEAQEGTTTTSIRRGERQRDTTQTVFFWLIDSGIIIISLGFFGFKNSQWPFCKDTYAWLETDSIGIIDTSFKRTITQHIKDENWHELKDMLFPKEGAEKYLDVHVGRCHAAADHAVIVVFIAQQLLSRFVYSQTISIQAFNTLTGNSSQTVEPVDEKTVLDQARNLIKQKQYNHAATLLQQIPQNPTAQQWLSKINNLNAKS